MMEETLTLLDLTAPEGGIEIEVRGDGKVLWVNVDGVCRLRISQGPQDRRRLEITLRDNLRVCDWVGGNQPTSEWV